VTHDDAHLSDSQPRARWALTVLLSAYILSFIDRNVMAFTGFYTFLGLPIGRLADRRSRRHADANLRVVMLAAVFAPMAAVIAAWGLPAFAHRMRRTSPS
jgi:MFS family permease